MNLHTQNKTLTSSIVLLCLFIAAFLPHVMATDLDSALPGNNTADGIGVLTRRTDGYANSGFGYQALNADSSGNYNTAMGFRALFENSTGNSNTAGGVFALFSNTNGYNNTAQGFEALASNTVGFRNAAVGSYALYNHLSGNFNNAVGVFALYADRTGNTNNAFGDSALVHNTSGNDNTALGDDALHENTTGHSNIGLGAMAGYFLTTGSNNIAIANHGVAGESGTIRVGSFGKQTRTFVAGIYGVHEGGTISPVYVNSNGQLGTQQQPSARRFKKEIRRMDNASESLLLLKPVTFNYKDDNTNSLQFGLIAEEVADVNPDLVVRDDNGEIYSVRYEAVNAMLLNEFVKEHRKVQELETKLAEQQKATERLAAQFKKHTAHDRK